jgi:hypothetical protein
MELGGGGVPWSNPSAWSNRTRRTVAKRLLRGGTMAHKVLNRKQLREEAEAAEAIQKKTKDKKPEAEKRAKRSAARKGRSKSTKEVRLKAYWGVFNQALSPVFLFEYNQRTQADKKAEELSQSRKSPHFVQVVKKVIEE